MIGAIAGDMIGSRFEHNPTKSGDFQLFSAESRFTDDTVLTVAVAYSILRDVSYSRAIIDFAARYPNAGFSGTFLRWVSMNYNQPDGHRAEPYNSFGNGSAMRVSPVGFAFDTVDTVLKEAQATADVSHNHPEGIKGAQAVALAVFLARNGYAKPEIRKAVTDRFGYNLDRRLADFAPAYTFDVTCQGSVPEAIICFLESSDFETAVRNAVSLGGDSDTQACIAGGIAQAYYQEIPDSLIEQVRIRLPDEFILVLDEFEDRYWGK